MTVTDVPRDALMSYARLARELNSHFGLEPGIDRRQVSMWARRRTRNREGDPFPEPAYTAPHPGPPRHPAHLYSMRKVIEWYAAGVPGPKANQWNGQWREAGE